MLRTGFFLSREFSLSPGKREIEFLSEEKAFFFFFPFLFLPLAVKEGTPPYGASLELEPFDRLAQSSSFFFLFPNPAIDRESPQDRDSSRPEMG